MVFIIRDSMSYIELKKVRNFLIGQLSINCWAEVYKVELRWQPKQRPSSYLRMQKNFTQTIFIHGVLKIIAYIPASVELDIKTTPKVALMN